MRHRRHCAPQGASLYEISFQPESKTSHSRPSETSLTSWPPWTTSFLWASVSPTLSLQRPSAMLASVRWKRDRLAILQRWLMGTASGGGQTPGEAVRGELRSRDRGAHHRRCLEALYMALMAIVNTPFPFPRSDEMIRRSAAGKAKSSNSSGRTQRQSAHPRACGWPDR